MVRLYSSYSKFQGIDGISVVDSYFNREVTDIHVFGDSDWKLLKDIEQAEPLKDGNNAPILTGDVIIGRFGTFKLVDMSSGVKTLLLLSLMEQGKIGKAPYIDITECGANVLEYVFAYAEELQIPCILLHFDFDRVPDFESRLDDDVTVGTTVELIDLLAARIGVTSCD